MTGENTVLIGLACAALLAVWLVYSLIKKVLGLALLAALGLAAYIVWSNPPMLAGLIGWAASVMGSR